MNSTFVVSTLVYPVLLAGLCLGAGLLVDRVSGRFLPGALLVVAGAAALIAVSQLTIEVPSIASSTPYVLAGLAGAGYLLGWRRGLGLVRLLPRRLWLAILPILAYFVGLAPVLLAGRPSFSGYGELPDSALHMIGADYLIRHGQQFAHLDLRNSYGQYIDAYFNHSYPSGSHTLFGGTAWLLDAPLIWTLQPFCAFILATAAGPAWLLARRVGLTGAWAALAALTITVPALVYGYELVASLKEVVALPLILGLGALVADPDRWLRGAPNRAIPFALLVAGGVSSLGVAFGPWALAATAVVLVLIVGDAVGGRRSLVRALPLAGAGLLVGLLAAWPTWADAAGSLQVAQGIAATSNPGNLNAALHPEQVFGSWISGSYRHRAAFGTERDTTYVLIAITLVAAVFGLAHVIRIRAWAMAGWVGLLLLLCLGLSAYGTTWADAKLLMLTSPLILLLAWAGVATVRASPLRLLAPLLALALAGGVIASDVYQYNGTDLAPTARYDELAAVDAHFAGQGPVLFTDFDEWSLYQLRDLDVGGPDFIFPPVGLEHVVDGHGDLVDLDKVSPDALTAYPLIVTRRDPKASRPPSAYDLAFDGSYYRVWARRPDAPAAIHHLRLSGRVPVACSTVRRLARLAGASDAQLVAAVPVKLVRIDLAKAIHHTWFHDHPARVGLLMTADGELDASFRIPRDGVWNLWIQGEIMPVVHVGLDGRELASVGGEVSGNVFNSDTLPPLAVTLTAGSHRLVISRGAITAAPGDGGQSLLHAVFLTPAGAEEALKVKAPARFRALCERRLDWIEITHA